VTAILAPAAPDAEAIRNRILQMFELAEAEEDPLSVRIVLIDMANR
jgi:hypothetical protein